jgi:alpha-beta hydrolase superfamily lysophospholipase
VEINESTVTFPSHDNVSTIHALLWEPDEGSETAVRGIIHIIHGASEHCARYRHFAAFLAAAGFVVCADDHIGHGKSVDSQEALGHLPLKGGLDILVSDEHTLRQIVAARYPQDTPYIMLGHSMGSFILRAYLARHGTGLAAAILSGTGQQPAALSAAGRLAARVVALLEGATTRSRFLDGLGMGALSKAIPDARTPLDWLSTDPAVVDAYIADEYCGMMFTAGGYATLTELTGDAVKPANAARVPKELPLLFIAGGDDPVGDKGVGVEKAARLYRDAGMRRVDLKIYEGLRHEILNEPIREAIYQDILDWFESLSGVSWGRVSWGRIC